jgi:hypothetical protein
MTLYEVYGNPEDGIGSLLIAADAKPEQKALGPQPGEVLLRTYWAESWCEASIRHNRDNGWDWYLPQLPEDLDEWCAAMRRLGYNPALVNRERAARGMPLVVGLPE